MRHGSVRGCVVSSLLTDGVRAALGTVVSYTAPEPLSRASIRYFATAIGADPDRWRDEAPPTLICETAQLTGRSAPDGSFYLGHTWELPLPVPCAMFRGGNDYRFWRAARPDDVIHTTWRLTDVVERRDSAGDPLLFVTAEATYRAGGAVGEGDLIATNTETMIYRPRDRAETSQVSADGPGSGSDPTDTEDASEAAAQAAGLGIAPQATVERPAVERPDVGTNLAPLVRRIGLPDMVAYGAATWDWHRLHYDPAFAQRAGAAAPLVDGQMLGALLGEQVLRFAGSHARLARLVYRNRAPVLAGQTVVCSGTVATADDAGFSVDLSVSVGDNAVVAPAFAQLVWASG